MNKIIILSGPTASGKTSWSLKLAERYRACVVNFDSLLLYQELSIGTAKPTKEEQGHIPHRMIDVASIANPLNAAQYVTLATPLIQECHRNGMPVILVGGSGFYLQALLQGMFHSPTTPAEIIQKSDTIYQQEGITPFLDILKKHDPLNFQRLHANDHYRVRRAVEHWWAHGSAFSQAKQQHELQGKSLLPQWNLLHLHLDMPKDEHLAVITARTQKMLQDGLIDEVKSLLARGFSGLEKPMQSIGYKETLDYLHGVISTEQELSERIVISTRQLAKAQRTWFKKQDKLTFHPLEQGNALLQEADKFIT